MKMSPEIKSKLDFYREAEGNLMCLARERRAVLLRKAGLILKRERRKCGLSVYDMAGRYHVTGAYISMIEHGKRSPWRYIAWLQERRDK